MASEDKINTLADEGAVEVAVALALVDGGREAGDVHPHHDPLTLGLAVTNGLHEPPEFRAALRVLEVPARQCDVW